MSLGAVPVKRQAEALGIDGDELGHRPRRRRFPARRDPGHRRARADRHRPARRRGHAVPDGLDHRDDRQPRRPDGAAPDRQDHQARPVGAVREHPGVDGPGDPDRRRGPLRDDDDRVGAETPGSGGISDLVIASKTGTAEHGADPKNTPPHAWYVAFAPADDPKVAVAVMVENGGDLGLDATGVTGRRADRAAPSSPPRWPGGRDDHAPGLLLSGRYRLTHRIAVGGMGEVWVADDIRLARVVAVKILRPELTGDPEFVRAVPHRGPDHRRR